MQNINLISNSGGAGHQKNIAEAMSWADEIVLCAAYWRQGCIELFRHELQSAMDRGKKIKMYVSLYDEITEAEALVELYMMSQKYYEMSFFICSKAPNIFHTKIYYFVKNDQFKAIIGSANFTQAAMKDNDEVSIKVEGHTSDPFHTQLHAYLSSLRGTTKKKGRTVVSKATPQLINSYIPKYNKRRSKQVLEIS